MTISRKRFGNCAAVCCALAALWVRADPGAVLPVEAFDTFDPATLGLLDARATVVDGPDGKALEATFGSSNPWPHVAIRRNLDLSAYTALCAEVANLSAENLRIGCRVDNEGATGQAHQSGGSVTLGPGESGTVRVLFNRSSAHGFRELLTGMDAWPDGSHVGATLDPARVVAVQFYSFRPTREQRVRIDNVRAEGRYTPPALPTPFLPFVDELGQYLHADWSGKTHGPEDLVRQREREEADLTAHPEPPGRNAYGGWSEGPKLEARGRFYTAQRDGRWWLVDPEGNLFWSFGVCCVRTGLETIIQGRDGWFRGLPADGEPLARFRGEGKALRGDLAGQTLRTYDFGSANLWRKYGDGWADAFAPLAHRRLRSWGFNTLGCWSKCPPTEKGKTPYVDWVYYATRNIRAPGVTRKPFPDVFTPGFEATLRQRAQRTCAASKDDPWCIGYFIDNELCWGESTTLGRAALKAPTDQPAKRVLIDLLRERHATIEALNTAWGAQFAGWEALDTPQEPPRGAGCDADLQAFGEKLAEYYFATCRRILNEVAPGKLYLGSRFAEYNAAAVAAAGRHCDVVSFNLYRTSVEGWQPPVPLERPVIIGEFHFGAPDRGVFGRGLQGVENQSQRAAALRRYVESAARHPLIVGAHWFQYVDEPVTGRPLDGENHQIGLVDLCDTPAWETVEAAREVGASLYPWRAP